MASREPNQQVRYLLRSANSNDDRRLAGGENAARRGDPSSARRAADRQSNGPVLDSDGELGTGAGVRGPRLQQRKDLRTCSPYLLSNRRHILFVGAACRGV